MSDWLTKQTPPAGPAAPAHVDLQRLLAELAAQAAARPLSPAESYLQAHTPPGQIDKWGEPLPLSLFEQERLDRLVGILVSPYARGLDLLHAGQLIHDEVDAIATGFPEIYAMLMERAWEDMVAHPPPYPVWAELALSVLFGEPPAKVWQAGTAPRPREPDMSKAAGNGGANAKDDAEPATPAQRREIPVREMRS